MPFTSSSTERSVAAPAAQVRVALADALRRLHFEVTAEHLTLLEGRRGSQLAAAALQLRKLPITATLRLESAGGRVAVTATVADRWLSPAGKAWGMNGSYAKVFAEVHAGLDEALRRLDPAVVLPPPEGTSTAATVGLLERPNSAGIAAGGAVTERAARVLDGPQPQEPGAWRDVDGVVFVAPPGEAELDLPDVTALLSVAMLVARKPGGMPPALAADVEGFAARLERALDAHPGGHVHVHVQIAAGEVPVVTFLRQQARIRATLPLRTLQVCRTCRLEKVVNPDHVHLVERNRKLRALTGMVGASIGGGGVSPFVLVGRVMAFAKLEPDFVCTRCQGHDADESIVTFCPTCGERRDESALRVCRRCKHDFRTDVVAEQLWAPAGTYSAPPPSLAPAPTPAALGAGPLAAGVAPQPPTLEALAAARASVPASGGPHQDWYADPSGLHRQRWWDGATWTAWVVDGAAPYRDDARPPPAG